jgi:hypothetical protein
MGQETKKTEDERNKKRNKEKYENDYEDKKHKE